MFQKILRAPPKFFDTYPSGTILNRFSKDMGSMDEMLPHTILDVLWVKYFSLFFTRNSKLKEIPLCILEILKKSFFKIPPPLQNI